MNDRVSHHYNRAADWVELIDDQFESGYPNYELIWVYAALSMVESNLALAAYHDREEATEFFIVIEDD